MSETMNKEIIDFHLKQEEPVVVWVPINRVKAIIGRKFDKKRVLELMVKHNLIASVEEIETVLKIGNCLRWNECRVMDTETKKVEIIRVLEISKNCLQDLKCLYQADCIKARGV